MIRKWGAALLLCLMLLCASTALAAGKTTVMMYMCGTDLQSDCLTDMKEICKADLGKDVNVIILAGGAKKWDDKRLAGGKLNLMTVQNGSFSKVTDWGKASMGDPATLVKFVTHALKTYPADRNILILWDHGGGSAQGVCFDEVHNNDGLTLPELDSALKKISAQQPGFHLDLLGCDACLMAGYETAVIAGSYADYFVASEELEPGQGWSYTPWLNALAKDSTMSSEAIGAAIVDAYKTAVKKERSAEYTTLSVIDLAALPALQADIEALAGYLTKALENGQLATISRMVKRMYALGTFDSAKADNDMYDLGNLLDICQQFAPTVTAQAREHLAKAVVSNYASAELSSACGLSVYIPQVSRRNFTRDMLPSYDLRSVIPNYVDFVTGLASMMNGGSYVFSASAPSSVSASSISDSSISFGAGLSAYIPSANYNAETNTFFIAGSAGATSTPSASGASSFIAGSAGVTPTPGPGAVIAGTDTTAAPGTPFFAGFIAGSAGQTTAAPAQVSATDLAFSITLDADSMANLNYAEGALFLDLSDDEFFFLVDLGYLRNSIIDWNIGTVYSTFDGSWPTLDGSPITLWDRMVTGAGRRSLIPVKVNGEETYLVVVFDQDSMHGRILGHNAGIDDNGLLIRRTTPLVPGDVIVPVYSIIYCTWDELEDESMTLHESEFDGDPIIWREGLEVVYAPVADPEDPADYQFTFYLNDIFGDFEMSDFISFTL